MSVNLKPTMLAILRDYTFQEVLEQISAIARDQADACRRSDLESNRGLADSFRSVALEIDQVACFLSEPQYARGLGSVDEP